ncbi:Xyloglucan endotransglucosylase/hydrolase protein 2 [Nymphaea thermarum]|nr:Xyloglucan endotransglucosylase/hydrolase protein 2 [Nymphaea thermarum]
MASMASQVFAAILLFSFLDSVLSVNDVAFDVNYSISWGADHVISLNQGSEIHLTMDSNSGSGFQSKLEYGSGFFHVNLKTPSRDTAGTVTAFYLTSHTNTHDELDFEFLGNLEGKPITLQTNVFVNGKGVDYPTQPMQVIASLWNGENWATDGGKIKIDWRYAPFVASFRGFSIDGCPANGHGTQQCSLPKYWWNTGAYTSLSATQKIAYQQVRRKYLTYDYCSDRARYHVLPPECPQLKLSGTGAQAPATPPFSDEYSITWGEDHAKFFDDGELQLSLDNSSGSGFASRSYYGSGFFDMDIKLPKNSAGVVTAYYLTSHTTAHDELDFEFLGNDEGTSIIVQTNVFVNGVTASVWDGSSWATDGGRKKVDWRLAPFEATFQGFSIDGCQSRGLSSSNCYSDNGWWSLESFIDLPADQLAKYEQARKKHLVYNYCDDRERYPVLPPECPE